MEEFPLLFLRFQASLSWMRTSVCNGGGIAALCLLAAMLKRDVPSGLVREIVRLPMPLT